MVAEVVGVQAGSWAGMPSTSPTEGCLGVGAGGNKGLSPNVGVGHAHFILEKEQAGKARELCLDPDP